MSFNMMIYGGKSNNEKEIYLKKLADWRNHYLLDSWFSNRRGGIDTEGLFIPFSEEELFMLKYDCEKAIDFLKGHVTEHRLYISPDASLADEWEYKWVLQKKKLKLCLNQVCLPLYILKIMVRCR